MVKVNLLATTLAPDKAYVAEVAYMGEVKAWLLVLMVVADLLYEVAVRSSFQCNLLQRVLLPDKGKPTISNDEVAPLGTTEAHRGTLTAIGGTNQLNKINKVLWVTSKVNKLDSNLVIVIVARSTSQSTRWGTSNMAASLSLSNYPRVRWLLSNSLSSPANNSTQCR
jgi:hypothetical protein